MNQKVKIGAFADALIEILEEYGDEIKDELPNAVEKSAEEGLKTLKAAAADVVGGRSYKRSFKIEEQRKTLATTYRIYSKAPNHRITHLLEHGHTMKNQYGGPYGVTDARPHWAQADEKAVEALEDEVKKVVEGAS